MSSREQTNKQTNKHPHTHTHRTNFTDLMYVPCNVYNLLFRPTNAQYMNSNVCFVKYSDMFQCIHTIIVIILLILLIL